MEQSLMAEMTRVIVNDEPVELHPQTTLQDALPRWHRDGGRFVVAVNCEFVPRARYGDVVLQDGDQIDLVKPIWGG